MINLWSVDPHSKIICLWTVDTSHHSDRSTLCFVLTREVLIVCFWIDPLWLNIFLSLSPRTDDEFFGLVDCERHEAVLSYICFVNLHKKHCFHWTLYLCHLCFVGLAAFTVLTGLDCANMRPLWFWSAGSTIPQAFTMSTKPKWHYVYLNIW